MKRIRYKLDNRVEYISENDWEFKMLNDFMIRYEYRRIGREVILSNMIDEENKVSMIEIDYKDENVFKGFKYKFMRDYGIDEKREYNKK